MARKWCDDGEEAFCPDNRRNKHKLTSDVTFKPLQKQHHYDYESELLLQ